MACIPFDNTFIEYKQSIIGTNGNIASTTNISCWHCTYPFKGTPKTVPVSYNKSKQSFEVVGVFCSWGCAKTWMSTRVEYNTPIKRMWLYEMARKHYGYDKDVIYPAPDPWVLKRFGGPMTIDAFRELTKNDYCETIHPPLLPACMAFVHGQTSDVTRSLAATRNDKEKDKEKNKSNANKKGIYHSFLEENHDETKTTTAIVTKKKKPTTNKKDKKKSSDAPKRRTRSSLQTFMKRSSE